MPSTSLLPRLVSQLKWALLPARMQVSWDMTPPTAGYFGYFGIWLCASMILSGLIVLNLMCLTSWSHIYLAFSCGLMGGSGILSSIFFRALLHDPTRGGLMNEVRV